jgi:ABC-type multidrug transport system fused ATPase/permease subunit
MCCWSTLSTFASISIKRWCESPSDGQSDLWIYAGLAISAAFFGFFRALVISLGSIKQGSVAHKKMIKGLLYASITDFYDRVPTGRILSRISKDLR